MIGQGSSLLPETSRKRFRRHLKAYLMVTPAMVFLLLFTFYPMANLAFLSFFEYNIVNPVKAFVGLRNYRELLFIKTDFLVALRNTSVYTVSVVVSLIVMALLFALWLQKDTKLDRFVQTSIFTPHLVAMISCGLIWAWLMETDRGVFNAVLNFLGMPSLRWLNSSKTAMMSVVIVSTWKSTGYYALILLSALKSIPAEIYEAAALDNARPLSKFFRITLPMLSPQLFFLLVTITINSFQVFDTIRIMTDGGPGNSTDVLSYYIYRYAFQHFKVGYASAAGTVLMVILMGMTVVYFKVLAKRVHYQ